MRVSTIQHELTHVPIHITTRFEDAELGVGTAFFYSFDGKDYLITNWHIVTGRNPLDNSVISSTGGIPDNLVVRLPYQEELESGVNIRKWVPKIVKLYKDADRHEPIWLEHPVYGCRVDAIAIEIEELQHDESGAGERRITRSIKSPIVSRNGPLRSWIPEGNQRRGTFSSLEAGEYCIRA